MAKASAQQHFIKQKYGINFGITADLTPQECDQLVIKLENDPEISKLVRSFIQKNKELGNNNRNLGKQRSQVEQKLLAVEAEFFQYRTDYDISNVQSTNTPEDSSLQDLRQENDALAQQLKTSQKSNTELTKANTILQKDNKDLKNSIDKIRLEMTRKIRELLQQEDFELRRSMVRMFKGILG